MIPTVILQPGYPSARMIRVGSTDRYWEARLLIQGPMWVPSATSCVWCRMTIRYAFVQNMHNPVVPVCKDVRLLELCCLSAIVLLLLPSSVVYV
jgi:hypothetical protein